MGPLYLNLCPGWCFTTNISQHKNGRIIVGWDPDAFEVNIISMSPQLVHCHVTAKPSGNKFYCTFIYGYSNKKGRESLWMDLCSLATMISSAWVIMGDFNAIMAIEDRIGSTSKLWGDIIPGPTNKMVQLECSLEFRVLANNQWEDTFPSAEAAYLPEEELDHCPMILSCYKTVQQKKPFRFYNMWIHSDKFMPLIETNWKKDVHGCHMFRVLQRLKWIKVELKILNKSGFDVVEATDINTHAELLVAQNALHAALGDSQLATEEKEANAAYQQAHQNYLSFLPQTAKLKWLELGDENSRLFHLSIKQRRKQNKINSIHDQEVNWVQSSDGVQNAFTQFYTTLFGVTMENRTAVKTIVIDQGARLNEDHLAILRAPID
ncbi:uncharacterized protein [Spinacia oleracea]|uniref:Endonuclease/exonuclease/phosphatase domain-containing protein n=1 Tax=Spinacia oleracea TaxID=3562 RepID=A0A9R0K0C2_SPIOL|nr:uncharacterized protein LOC110792469 [Spinacia oleracea]